MMTAALVADIFIVLPLLVRSAVAPFYLLASVVLSYAATMGLCTYLFVGILDKPDISFFLPPFLFIILVALGADYNIFVMSRIREEADNGPRSTKPQSRPRRHWPHHQPQPASSSPEPSPPSSSPHSHSSNKIGFGVTVGVLIDTFLVRSLIVPAATMILGKWTF